MFYFNVVLILCKKNLKLPGDTNKLFSPIREVVTFFAVTRRSVTRYNLLLYVLFG